MGNVFTPVKNGVRLTAEYAEAKMLLEEKGEPPRGDSPGCVHGDLPVSRHDALL